MKCPKLWPPPPPPTLALGPTRHTCHILPQPSGALSLIFLTSVSHLSYSSRVYDSLYQPRSLSVDSTGIVIHESLLSSEAHVDDLSHPNLYLSVSGVPS